MEIKTTLNKPYTEAQRLDFIVEQNHKQGFEIKETETALEAWGYTEEEKQEQERARLDALSMTRSDFFDGMIMAFSLDSKELRAIVEQVLNSINITSVEIKVALNNYDNALNFYRKHTLFTLLNNVPIEIGEYKLIFTSDIWDKFFDTKDYRELQKAIQIKPEPEPEPIDDDSDTDTDSEVDND